MNDNAKKWVAALRSGNYKQGRGVLKSPHNEYCCLGVACELYRQEHPNARWSDLSAFMIGSVKAYQEALPIEVQEWLGLKTSLGQFSGGRTLAGLNDHYYASFDQIADQIESEPEGLFIKE